MSWWDPNLSFSGLASQALKTAQKQIDKVLDIEEKEKQRAKKQSLARAEASTSVSSHKDEDSNSWNSWGSWMAPKVEDSEDKTASKAQDSQSAASSALSFSWGSQQDSATSASSSSFSHSTASQSFTSVTEESASHQAKLGLSGIDEQKKKVLLPNETDASVSETEFVNVEDKLDAVKTSERLAVDDRKMTVKSSESVAEEDSKITVKISERLGVDDSKTAVKNSEVLAVDDSKASVKEPDILNDGDSKTAVETSESVAVDDSFTNERLSEVKKEPEGEVITVKESFLTDDDPSSAETLVLSQNTEPQFIEEEVSETRTVVVLPGEKEDTAGVSASEKASESEKGGFTTLSESEKSEDSGQLESAETNMGLWADLGNEEEQTGEKATEELPETSGSILSLTDSENRESVEVAENTATSEASLVHVSSSYETIETIPEGATDGEDTLETSDMAVSEASSETVQGQSPDSALSRDSSFAQISFSENAQVESVTSVTSEPTLLSMSSEGKGFSSELNAGCENIEPFSPQSHSSFAAEEEKESESPPPGLSSPKDEHSPVGSPPPDSTATASSNESSETSRLDSSADTLVDRGHQLTEESESERLGGEDSGEQWLVEDSSLAGLGASSSPSTSFVKCMIEEAMGMEDPSKLEDSSSDNPSEEKSESSKVDSEFEKSVYSGHESSDDIETTTSSDIEIISTPTPNGEKNIVDLSPLRFSLQKAVRVHVPGHHRTDSQSSSSTNSKGEVDHLSPERDSDLERGATGTRGGADGWQREDDDLDNPQHPQRLLKKLAETAEILQARERQLVQLSKDNNDLLETNSILRSQLQQSEEARETEMTDVNALTEEFSRRMGEAERKMQTILKEKEAVKEQLQVAQNELASRSSDVNLEAVLAEKDEQITGLLEEGEKLSKQQLQNSNIIKKLRTKEKENEKQLASQKKKLDQQKEELDKLKEVLDSREDMEKKQADAIKQLNTAVQMIEKDKARLAVEVEASEEKIRGLQSTLDNSYKEIAELHKNNASQDSRAQQAALSAEMQVREELKMAMEQEAQRHRQEREALVMQIEDLRMSLARMEKEHNRREEMLKQEITDLQMRLQEDESRSQDLTQSVSSATRPLLRQIENLQATHNMQSAAWEKVEKNLTERLKDAQTQLALAQEKERMCTEKLTEATSRCAALETSNSLLRQEKATLAAQQDSDRRRIDLLEERKANDVAQLELAKQKLSEEVAALRRDKVFLESQLETERSRMELEKQRVSVAEEQIRILERERPKSRGTPSPVSVSRQESMNNSFSERSSTPTWLAKPDDVEGQFITNHGVKVSLYDSMRQSGAASLMENLQSQLKLREGEITQLQAEIQQLERTRESMARELVNLTNLNEELQEKVNELPQMHTLYKDLDGRYNALLQMYGEKEERVQELMMDLEDVKDMYKQQINSLMK